MSLEVPHLRKTYVATLEVAGEWFLLVVGSQMVKELVQIIQYETTHLVATSFLVNALQNTVVHLLVFDVNDIVEDVIFHIRH